MSSDDFDPAWYAARYKDVSGSGLTPREHFASFGTILRRDGSGPKYKPNPILPEVKVSVLCITYNHEKYISEALDSFIAQDTPFPIEFIIADDCSSDSTPEIIKQYAALDSRIVPVLRSKNLGPNQNFAAAANLVKGQYLALCEGDDYWTDPTKLNQQVKFLDANADYALCFHQVNIVYEDEPGRVDVFPPDRNISMSLTKLVEGNAFQTNSVMYRWRYRRGLPLDYDSRVTPQDWHLHLLHAEVGGIAFIPKVMAVYRKHSAGMWASSTQGIAHRRRYGRGQLILFDDLTKRFGGFYKQHFSALYEQVFKELLWDLLDRNDVKGVMELMEQCMPAAMPTLKKLKYQLPSIWLEDEQTAKQLLTNCASIDVIVLSYNHANTIEQCLKSILGQEGLINFRIIVGDDASTDGTNEVIARLSAANPGKILHLKSQDNLGMLSNMRRCIELCNAEFTAFCEGDDHWISKRKLWKQYKVLRSEPQSDLCFNWVLLEHDEDGSFSPHFEQSQIQGAKVTFFDLIKSPLTANFSCCFYRTAAIKSIPHKYFDQSWAADWLFNLYITNRAPAVFCRELLSVYRIHSNGLWSSLSPAVQLRKIHHARTYFAKEFAPGSGASNLVIKVSIEYHKELYECVGTSAALDRPRDSEDMVTENGSLNISGWVYDQSQRNVEIIVSSGHGSKRVQLTLSRPDVVSSLRNPAERCFRYSDCGFQTELLVENEPESHRIDIIIGDKIVPWLTLRTQWSERIGAI